MMWCLAQPSGTLANINQTNYPGFLQNSAWAGQRISFWRTNLGQLELHHLAHTRISTNSSSLKKVSRKALSYERNYHTNVDASADQRRPAVEYGTGYGTGTPGETWYSDNTAFGFLTALLSRSCSPIPLATPGHWSPPWYCYVRMRQAFPRKVLVRFNSLKGVMYARWYRMDDPGPVVLNV